MSRCLYCGWVGKEFCEASRGTIMLSRLCALTLSTNLSHVLLKIQIKNLAKTLQCRFHLWRFPRAYTNCTNLVMKITFHSPIFRLLHLRRSRCVHSITSQPFNGWRCFWAAWRARELWVIKINPDLRRVAQLRSTKLLIDYLRLRSDFMANISNLYRAWLMLIFLALLNLMFA